MDLARVTARRQAGVQPSPAFVSVCGEGLLIGGVALSKESRLSKELLWREGARAEGAEGGLGVNGSRAGHHASPGRGTAQPRFCEESRFMK